MSGAPAPSRSGRAALFVYMLAGWLLTVCVASPGPGVQVVPTQVTEARASTSPSAGTQPPLNRLEVKVIDALAPLGVTAHRAEIPFQDASISAQLRPGAQLFVKAAPTAAWRSDFSVVDERELAGIRVQHVQYAADRAAGVSARHRFECAGDTYEVRGAVPTGSSDMDEFVARFIRALGCGA